MWEDFLQNVQFKMLTAVVAAENNKSKTWSSAYKWFINPVILCPYCREWLETKRVWVVDEDNCKVVRLFELDGRPLRAECCHPHVGAAGAICMGTASNVTQALFSSLNSEDAYVKVEEWLPEILNHECEEMLRGTRNEYVSCYKCYSDVHIDEIRYSEFDAKPYCCDCYNAKHWTCNDCGDDFHMETGIPYYEVKYEVVCDFCFTQKYFTCEKCDDHFANTERGDDNLCVECFEENELIQMEENE